jgi:hypothetical protein
MAVRILSAETWRKIGKPDLGSKMYYINWETKKKVYGSVTEISFGHKKGVKIRIKKY